MKNPQYPPIPIQQMPIEVNFYVRNVFDRFKDIKQTNVRTMIQDVVPFVSIIGAYYTVGVTLEKQKEIEEWTGINFRKVDAEAGLLLVFALYLITLKILHFVAYKYDIAPPKKVLPPNWEEMEESSSPGKAPVESNEKKQLGPDAYSVMIQELLNYSIYGLVFMFCTTAYTFVSLFNKKNKFVAIEQINYLVLWFVAACIFYSLGKILGKMTKINTLHHFGLAIGVMVLIIEIGISHGFNMFLFV